MDINYSTIKNLNMLTREELIESSEMESLTLIINSALEDQTKCFNAETMTDHIISQNFYIPRIASFGNRVGFFLGGEFLAIKVNLGLGAPDKDAKPDEPVRYDVDIESEHGTFTTSLSTLPGVKPNKLIRFVSTLFSDEGVANEESMTELIKLMAPAPVSSLADGDYDVKSFQPGENSNQLTLENGLLVTVNRATPRSIRKIRSVKGVIYMIENNQPVRGISVTGQATSLVPGDAGNCNIGDTYEVHGVVTNSYNGKEYTVASLAPVGEAKRSWCHVEGNVASLAIRRITKGQPVMIKVSAIKPKTGNMKNPKPIWSPV